MSRKKLRRDREAGLHFHWHLPHGSLGRLAVGGLVATLFWGALLAYVEVRLPTPPPLAERATELEVVNLDHPANRWLAEVIERESPFHARWDVTDDASLEKAIATALVASKPASYQPALMAVDRRPSTHILSGLPGVNSKTLPATERVELPPITRPNPDWWLSVTPVISSNEWPGTSFRWSGENSDLSPGESWTFQLLIDWRGTVVSCLPLNDPQDPRALKIAETLRVSRFPILKKGAPLRQWQLEASAVDRSSK